MHSQKLLLKSQSLCSFSQDDSELIRSVSIVFLDYEIIKYLFLWCIQLKSVYKLHWLYFTSASTFQRLYETVLFSPKSPDYKYSRFLSLVKDLWGTKFLLLTPVYSLKKFILRTLKIMTPRNLNLCN